MTLEKTIQLAREQGMNIEYVHRADGGIRITKINNTSYKRNSSAGNTALRSIMGGKASLSGKMKKALKKNAKKTTSQVLGKQYKEFTKKNKARAKAGLNKIKNEQAKKTKKNRGAKGVKKMLKSMENSVKHKLDFAYEANVAWFVEALESARTKPNRNKEFYDFSHLIEYIKKNSDKISDRHLEECHQIFYAWLDGKLDGDMAEIEMFNEISAGINELEAVKESM